MINPRMLSTKFIIVPLVLTVVLICQSKSALAQAPKTIGSGRISIDAKDSEATPTYILYHSATVTTKDGSKLTADEIKAFETSGDKLEKATANGNVKAVVTDAATKGNYVVTADSGIYDPVADTIELSGDVKSTTSGVESGSTTSGKEPYTIIATADNALYDLNASTISLTGNVKTSIASSNTEGPIVQTGTSAVITLGVGPDFPKVDMQQVHTELTVKQK